MSDETEEQKKLMRQIDISCVQAFHTMDEIDAMVELAKKYRLVAVFTFAGVQRPCGRTAAGHQRNPCGRRGKLSGRRRYDRTEEAAGKELWEAGCREIDMVMNLTAFRSHEFSYVKEELLAIREQVPSAIFKVIIEAPQLTEQEICQAVDLCVEGRADYVKTSTGWYPGCPSTVEQVRIMSREAAGRIQIKAAGGIRSLETIQEMQKAGCSRFGMGMRSVQNLIKSIYK